MRPQPKLRALRAMTALCMLTMTTILAVSPGTALSDNGGGQPVATTAAVADITPGPTRLNVLAGRTARVSGRIAPGVAGKRVALQKRTGHRWTTVARARTRAGGLFRVAYRPPHSTSAPLRIAADAHRRTLGRLNAYRRATVSWYGPGLYGNKLSCGGRLTPSTIGVANKSLPCGKRLTLRKGNHIVRARVVDRGPYVGRREFDLTSATRRKLHFSGVGQVLVTS
ncbi:MAG: septal ring lytic transglycosylase RlpA family protein [Solirubrobacteraceae bacterium]